MKIARRVFIWLPKTIWKNWLLVMIGWSFLKGFRQAQRAEQRRAARGHVIDV